ncbi:hypothetical protein AB205_0193990 [Aquarana catesbeiana]|uniref:Uncharacterized protein n=1 Tax=Aquarana catesbeiana TaxID=8400 RepID=A0A2G9RF70_AQUCT|nr:hypothetical protein AB205_0193990 [Aquarana catesbeiana]
MESSNLYIATTSWWTERKSSLIFGIFRTQRSQLKKAARRRRSAFSGLTALSWFTAFVTGPVLTLSARLSNSSKPPKTA